MSQLRNLPQQTSIIKGNADGPCVAIVGCMHGDERIGAQILDWLLDHVSPGEVRGELRLILGNPLAYDKDVRFTETDLNRLMIVERAGGSRGPSQDQPSYEWTRAQELKPLLQGVQFLLDIHATRVPTKHSFTYSADTEQHYSLARLFEIDYMLSERDASVTSYPEGPLDTYVDNIGGVGITLEAGWRKDPNVLEQTKAGVGRYLQSTGVCPSFMSQPQENTPEKLVVFTSLIAESNEFRFVDDHYNLKFFQSGEVLAYDGERKIAAEQDCFLVFPKLDIAKGLEVGFLAERV